MDTDTPSLETEKRSPEEKTWWQKARKRSRCKVLNNQMIVWRKHSTNLRILRRWSLINAEGSDAEVVPKTIPSQPPRVSYRDSLVGDGLGKLNPKEIAEMVAEEYISDSESLDLDLCDQVPFNSKPNIDVTLEEYED
ncbi:hypothetical protein AHAS_Ahas03G0242900 [Arachis hypogaea]